MGGTEEVRWLVKLLGKKNLPFKSPGYFSKEKTEYPK